MEIIAFASGKGGTGKTLMASCLGYALIQAGHRVLMIDADPATDGLSLFLLGPKGTKQIQDFQEANTFTGALHAFSHGGSLLCEPRRINRAGPEDHGVTYQALISGRGLYGDDATLSQTLAVPDLDQETFRKAVKELFASLKRGDRYDYVIVDTRGGFAFESTDVCAMADSLIVVTEPDFTSFYQDRNLIRRISAASEQIGSKTLLRSVIVNKATESEQTTDELDLRKVETSFRIELTKEFPLRFEDTHPVPVDVEALKAYKTQRLPYRTAPASLFSFATLSAFSDILQVVTARWQDEQIKGWNALVTSVSEAVDGRNKELAAEANKRKQREEQSLELQRENRSLEQIVEQLKREIERTERQYERELARSEKPKFQDKNEAAVRDRTFLGFTRRFWFVTILAAAFLELVGFGGFRLLRTYEQSRIDDLVTKAYSPSLPVVLRTTYMKELLTSYHKTDFAGISLKGAVLDNSNFRGVSFPGADFTNASLSRADLSSAKLTRTTFTDADMSGAQLRQAQAVGADFTRASLVKADLTSCDLSNAVLLQANLSGANLRGAIANPMQLGEAITDEGTIFPDGTSGHRAIYNRLPSTSVPTKKGS
jgi:uncharacterized protein YjbI with pentapeptide repeats/MinD-like ATPase involved in chromosome partitioning or flagellar assembly